MRGATSLIPALAALPAMATIFDDSNDRECVKELREKPGGASGMLTMKLMAN